jgi:glucosamine 6-phosphate synthetase-like amidotransferase/phosphosugar isomerase protein
VDLEVLQVLQQSQDNQEDQVVVDLGKVDQVMLEQVIHLQLVRLKEILEHRVQEILVMQEAEAEEHLQLVLLPHNQVENVVEQVVVEQHQVLTQHLQHEPVVVVEVQVNLLELVELHQEVVDLEEMETMELEIMQLQTLVVAVVPEQEVEHQVVEMVVQVW